MGVYLNPSAADFSEKVGKKTFVDKTELLKDICDRVNDPDRKYVAVSRPRRFGKTTDANMLVAWFGRKDHSSLFRNLKISECSDRYQKYQNGFDVIKADMSKGTFRFSCIRDYIEDLDRRILREISLEKKTEALMKNDSLSACLDRIFAATGEQFIVVLDEWDAPLRLFPDDMPGHLYYAGWLNDLLKGKDYLALVYMTGILPIKKYGDDSFMNMFDEISMIDPGDFAPYMGFTEEDVRELCLRFGKSIEPYRQWYDGYLLTVSRLDEENGELCEDGIRRTFQAFRIYNPKSIVKAMTVNNLDNYWDHTGNFAALRDYIDTDQIGLRPMIVEMMQGGRRKIDVRTYQNDLVRFENADDVLTMLIHLGYLTYDARSRETYIPNRELMSEFSTATRESSLRYGKLFGIMKDSAALLKATWNQDTETVAQTIEEMHELVCSAKDYNSELALMFTVEFAYSAARALYTVFRQAPAGKGYADMILVPVDRTHPAMVIELKWNQSVKTAIDQIKEKNYPSRLRLYEGNILCVGISYEKTDAKDAGYKKHACRIERL